MKVSVITPNFNGEKFIAETIQSVVAQTYSNWELIICDDGSTDNSRDVIKQYQNLDPRILLLQNEKRLGPAVARNRAIEIASGNYIAFLDGDDLWMPTKIEKQLEFMQRNNFVLTYSYYRLIDEEGNDLRKEFLPELELTYSELLKSNQIGCLTAMYSVDQLGKIFMPLINKRQDYALWLKILKEDNNRKAVCIPEVLAMYRVRHNSISSNKLEMVKYHWRLFREIEGFPIYKSLYYLMWNIFRKLKH